MAVVKLPLADAIENLYVAFDEARRPVAADELDICPCCVDDANTGPLLSTGLRQLTEAELREYMFTATGPVTGADFLYFFPRIVQGLFVEDWSVAPTRHFERLGRVEADRWTPRQRSGLTRFMSSVLAEIDRFADVFEDSFGWMLEEAMYCHALSGLAMTPVLDDLLKYPTLLATFYEQNPELESTGTLSLKYEPPIPVATQVEIREWMQLDRVVQALTETDE